MGKFAMRMGLEMKTEVVVEKLAASEYFTSVSEKRRAVRWRYGRLEATPNDHLGRPSVDQPSESPRPLSGMQLRNQ
ncbi:hypothetical protein J6590_047862 [Homalodisca vitripennis]|nr:hypothetical protein J6590_047862 [Homalodisca vitripennis]